VSSLETRHRAFYAWVGSEEEFQTVLEHGDRITHVGVFMFLVNSAGQISIVDVYGNSLSALPAIVQQAVAAWPHITWLLTVRNDGYESIFRALLTDPAAQDKFISELHRILDAHPWAAGVDIDLERGPNDLKEQIYALYQRIHTAIKGRSKQRHVHLDLPPMEGPGQTVGPEKWCEYERLRGLADTVAVMTYGFAWAGSAPGPVSPVAWVRRVMDYASIAFDAENQLFMGVPQYGFRWQIYDYPANLGEGTRGEGKGGGFTPFLDWMLGLYSHTDGLGGRPGTMTQPFISWASFYDEQNFVHRLLLHIYDYPGAGEEDSRQYPMLVDSWDRPFLTCYNKTQRANFRGTVVDLAGTDYTSAEGAFVENQASGAVAPRQPIVDPEQGIEEQDCVITYTFSVPEGTYDVVVCVNFPWWDRQLLHFRLDGVDYYVGNVPQWYPYHRTPHWVRMARLTLSAGIHTLELLGQGSHYGTVLTQIRVCSAFTEEHYGGEAVFTVRPRYFLDRNRQPAWPYQGRFRVTLEVLRRPPDYALVWWDNFTQWPAGSSPPSPYYNVVSGQWTVHHFLDDDGDLAGMAEGSGEFRLGYSGFRDLLVRADIVPLGTGRAGVVFGNLWLALNPGNGRLELYEGSTLRASYAAGITTGRSYRIALRVRGGEVAGFFGPTEEKVLTSTAGASTTGAPGIKAEGTISCTLLDVRDAYWRMPQEAVDVTLPDGRTVTLGRIPRTGVTWDDRWGMFRLGAGEEPDTRQQPSDGMAAEISMDWDYLHSPVFTLPGPGNYTIRVRVRDTGVWLSTLYLGDADGFSLAVFPDAETVLRLADLAAYEYGAKGVALWRVGLEDPQLWTMLVRHA